MSRAELEALFEKFLNDTMNREELRRFQELIHNGRNKRILYRMLREAFDHHTDLNASGEDIGRIYADFLVKARQPRAARDFFPGRVVRFYRQNRNIAVAATILLPLLCAILFLYFHTSSAPQVAMTITAKTGERKNMVLPDGSKVQLNAGSTLVLAAGFNSTGREISLSGEAYFDVAKNKDMPLMIHTPTMDIKVLGTTFNVRAYPDEVKDIASLISGRILVRLKKGTDRQTSTDYYLSPLQKIIIQKNNSGTTQTGNMIRGKSKNQSLVVDSLRVNRQNDQIAETAWTENRLAFNAESLSEVISKVEKWYGVKVRLDNPAIENLHFTGSYQNEDLRQVMDAIHLANPDVRYKLENDDQLLILF